MLSTPRRTQVQAGTWEGPKSLSNGKAADILQNMFPMGLIGMDQGIEVTAKPRTQSTIDGDYKRVRCRIFLVYVEYREGDRSIV